MKIVSFDSTLHKIIKEIADAYNIKFDLIADNRIIKLSSEEIQRYIVGYYFDLNDSVSWMIAKYKHLASDIFQSRGIPHVEHKVFRNPKVFSDIESNWIEMIEFAKRHDYDIVCKPNSGSFGSGVVHISSQARLEEVVTNLFARYSAIALSPYYRIVGETRFVILDSECVLIYKKERPFLRGNGKDSVAKLLVDFIPSFDTLYDFTEFFEHQGLDESDSISLSHILSDGEVYHLGWKHNAAKASSYTILSESPFENLAIEAAKALNLSFASIDVIETSGGPMIIEANAGVSFRKLYKTHYNMVKDVYSKAVKKMFWIEE